MGTRLMDQVELEENYCTHPVADENCTCAENFVRENGVCIHKDECTVCIDEYGNVHEEGSTRTENCKIYQCLHGDILESDHVCNTICPIGLVYDPNVPSDLDPCCGKCVPETLPGTSCKLETATKTLSTKDENGAVCVSEKPIEYSYCKGGCDNSGGMFSGEFAINGVVVTPAASDCKCCTGTGAFETHTFMCNLARREIQVKQMASCSCNVCGEDGFEAPEGTEQTNEAENAAGGGLFGDETPETTEAEQAPTPDLGGLFGNGGGFGFGR